jgi:hypothetical protein
MGDIAIIVILIITGIAYIAAWVIFFKKNKNAYQSKYRKYIVDFYIKKFGVVMFKSNKPLGSHNKFISSILKKVTNGKYDKIYHFYNNYNVDCNLKEYKEILHKVHIELNKKFNQKEFRKHKLNKILKKVENEN